MTTRIDFSIGDRVSWQLSGGRTMAGEVIDRAIGRWIIQRVDGAVVSVDCLSLRLATEDDILDACEVSKGWQAIESGRGN